MSQVKEQSGFLSRWSQRKLTEAEKTEPVQLDSDADSVALPEENTPAEAEQDENKPVWQRDNVDAETKKAALRTLFRKPEFNVRDGLNEYDDDFTQFASLGNVITHEMKRMLKLAEEKTRPDPPKQSSAHSGEVDSEQPQNDNEDKDLA